MGHDAPPLNLGHADDVTRYDEGEQLELPLDIESQPPMDVLLLLTEILRSWNDVVLQQKRGKGRKYMPLHQMTDQVEVGQYVLDQLKELIQQHKDYRK